MQNSFNQSFGSNPSTMFSFGSSNVTPATTASQFNGSKLSNSFGATTTNAAQPSFLSFGAATSTQPNQLSLSLGTTTAPTTISVGLGGSSVLTSTTLSLTSTSSAIVNQTVTNISNPKQNVVPNEVLSQLESFKTFMKKQREISSEIACNSIKPADEIRNEMAQIEKLLAVSDNDLKRDAKQISTLKNNMNKLLHSVDLVQKQHGFATDSVSAQGYYNKPNFVIEYLFELVAEFEEKLQMCKNQLDQVEQIASTFCSQNDIAPEELVDCLRMVQDIFTAVAGQLYHIHGKIQDQKRSFLEIRRLLYNDSANIFDMEDLNSIDVNSPRSLAATKIMPGPSPFSSLLPTLDSTAIIPETNSRL